MSLMMQGALKPATVPGSAIVQDRRSSTSPPSSRWRKLLNVWTSTCK